MCSVLCQFFLRERTRHVKGAWSYGVHKVSPPRGKILVTLQKGQKVTIKTTVLVHNFKILAIC